MKLPGIQYGQVQSQGRYDVNAPAREAQGTARVAEAQAGVARTAHKAYSQVYEAESARQATKAANMFDTAYLEQENQKEAYDADGNPVWSQGSQTFEEMTTNAISAAKPEGLTDLAQEKFRQYTEAKGIQYKAAWEKKTHNWWMQDGLANAQTAIADAVGGEDWDQARELIKANAMFLGAKDVASSLAGVDNAQAYRGFEIRGEAIDITRISQGAETSKLLASIEKSEVLSAADKKTLTAKTKHEVVLAHRDSFLSIGSKIANDPKRGVLKAIDTLKGIMDKVVLSGPEQFGGDVILQHEVHSAMEQEYRHFVNMAAEVTGNAAGWTGIHQFLSGEALVNKDYNTTLVDDSIDAFVWGAELNKQGHAKQDTINPNVDKVILSGQKAFPGLLGKREPQDGLTTFADLTVMANYVPKRVSNYISAALRSGGAEGVDFALGFIHKLQESPRGMMALNSEARDNDLKRLLGITEVLGLDNSEAISRVFNDGLNVTEEEKKAYWQHVDEQKVREGVDKEMPGLLKEAFPVKGWFFNKSIETQQRMQNQLWDLAKQQMQTHYKDNWTPEQAARSAMAIFKTEYSVSQLGGHITPMQNSAEVIFGRPNHKPKEDAAWIEESLRSQIAARAAENGTQELPETFNYQVMKVNGVNAIVPWVLNADGSHTTWAPTVPKIQGTKQGHIDLRNKIKTSQLDQLAAEATKSKVGKSRDIDNNPGLTDDQKAQAKLANDFVYRVKTGGANALYQIDKFITQLHGDAPEIETDYE